MFVSPHPRSAIKEPPLPAAVRFECKCKLDACGSATLELSGELDRAVCSEFEKRLAEVQRAATFVTLDLRRLTFIDSAGYAALVFAARDSKPEAKLVLAGCVGQVSRLLNLLGLPEKVEFQGLPIPATPLESEASVGA
ncbi:MAG TPA: STAS domain-containing protein [Solirubrobacterales bacterium]